jgi:hypothetical protein
MNRFTLILFLVLPGLAQGQQLQQQPPPPRIPLREVAETARNQWQRQDAPGLVARSPQLIIQLPGADPSAPVQRRQATELLRDFFERSEEVETVLSDARELGNGWGLVEFRRKYRIRGTQAVNEQLLLLSYRASGGGWILVELRVGR